MQFPQTVSLGADACAETAPETAVRRAINRIEGLTSDAQVTLSRMSNTRDRLFGPLGDESGTIPADAAQGELAALHAAIDDMYAVFSAIDSVTRTMVEL